MFLSKSLFCRFFFRIKCLLTTDSVIVIYRVENRGKNPETSKITVPVKESLKQRSGAPSSTYFPDKSYKTIWKD